MKNLFILVLILFSANVHAQQKMDKIPESLDVEIMQKAALYRKQLDKFRIWLSNKTGISAKALATNHVKFRWPMRVNSNYDDMPDYYTISNYMDLNRDKKNEVQLDWYCNQLNYDGHEGNDYSIYPFFWRMMVNDNVFACAGAAGIVVGARDNQNNSYNCMRDTFENNIPNYVAIMHSDSSITRYVHLKENSVRVVDGQYVEEGHLLGKIASSGRSSNPHLHFDLKHYRESTNEYNFIEPFVKTIDTANDCNDFANTSWWKNQKNYVEPKLLRVMTHSGTPLLQGKINFTENINFCVEGEDAKVKTQFAAGEQVTIGVALAHCRIYDSIHITVCYPNGVALTNISRSVPDRTDGALYDWRSKIYLTQTTTLPGNAASGTYKIKTELIYRPFDATFPFQSQQAAVTSVNYSYFTVGCISSRTLAGNISTEYGQIVSNDINSTQVIQSRKTRYQSANYIQLNPGFTATAGSIFKARIRNCDFTD